MKMLPLHRTPQPGSTQEAPPRTCLSFPEHPCKEGDTGRPSRAETQALRPASSSHSLTQNMAQRCVARTGRAPYLSGSSSIGGNWKWAPHGRPFLSSGWSRLGSSGGGHMFTTQPSWDQTEMLTGAAWTVDTGKLCPQCRSLGDHQRVPFLLATMRTKLPSGEAAPSSQTERGSGQGECRGPQGGPRPLSKAGTGEPPAVRAPSRAGRSSQSQTVTTCPSRSPQGSMPERSDSSSSNRYVHPTLTPALVTVAKGRKSARCPLTDG